MRDIDDTGDVWHRPWHARLKHLAEALTPRTAEREATKKIARATDLVSAPSWLGARRLPLI